jgi:hypothetical protein
MKKFGKKHTQILNINKDNEIYEIYGAGEEDDIYDRELSKKLHQSRENQEKETEKYFLFKNYKKLQRENFQETIAESNNHNNEQESKTQHKKFKLKRLSELEENNLYFSLNIDQHASKDEIKRAYKNLCYTHHPDKGGNVDNFHKVNKAHQILANNLCRKLYDTFSQSAMSLIDHILSRNTDDNEFFYLNEIDVNLLDLDTISAVININTRDSKN